MIKLWKNSTKALSSVGGVALSLLLCLCLSLSCSLPASAVNLTGSGMLYPGNISPTTGSNGFGCSSYATTWNSWAGNACNSTANRINLWVPYRSGSTPAQSFVFASMSVSGNSNTSFTPIPFNGEGLVWSDIDGDNGNFVIKGLFYFAASRSGVPLFDNAGFTSSNNFNSYWFSNARIEIDSFSYITVSNPVTISDVTQIKNYLNTQNSTLDEIKSLVSKIQSSGSISGVISQQQATNNKLDSVNSNLENLQKAQEENNNQQKEQYEQEKQEENQREEKGNADSSELAGIFNFTAFNPFSGIFALFTGGNGCISIPIVGGMLNKPDGQYCPWFPSSIRNVLTPVIGLASMMIIFGFFVSWLNGGDVNGKVMVSN